MTTLDANGHEVNLAQRDLHGPDGCEDEDVIATLEFEYQPDLPVEAHNLVGWARLRLETHGDLLAAAEAALLALKDIVGAMDNGDPYTAQEMANFDVWEILEPAITAAGGK
jgi:hypothetical protein